MCNSKKYIQSIDFDLLFENISFKCFNRIKFIIFSVLFIVQIYSTVICFLFFSNDLY